jgi:hypothetical protein
VNQTAGRPGIAVEVGGLPILLRSSDACFLQMLERRYAGFLASAAQTRFQFDIDLVAPSHDMASDEDVNVFTRDGHWYFRRGDFRAQWDPLAGQGHIRQTANPYSTDSVLRIVHSLILAREGGFLLHAASAVRAGQSFLFSGVSGAGKTTISRLAPADVTLLTDEVSYVRRTTDRYFACGTPFAGELARAGENCTAPLAALYFLEKGPESRSEPVSAINAIRALLRNILFFAEDEELVKLIFRSACKFVDQVPVYRLTFVPDRQVWSLIGSLPHE